MEFSIIGLTPPYHPYFQPKSKCVLNDSEWLETNFKQVFENYGFDIAFFLVKASLIEALFLRYSIASYLHMRRPSVDVSGYRITRRQ